VEKVLTSATFVVCLTGVVLIFGGVLDAPETRHTVAVVWLSLLGLAAAVDLGRVLWWLAKR
jgi:hypothetical protein